MITIDFLHSWASGPIAEIVEDPMHQADMTIVQLAHVTGMTEETQAAIDRIRARSAWSYEEGGRRYAAALREYRARPLFVWIAPSKWWGG